MPVIEIRRRIEKFPNGVLYNLLTALPAVAAEALSCDEGGALKPLDIIIEVDEVGPHDVNVKDISLRVFAHDYPARQGVDLANLKVIRKKIAAEVLKYLPERATWYVWVLLAHTSYGSDTEED